jgi:hypothetical protein
MAIRKGKAGSKEEGGARVSKGDGASIKTIKNFGSPNRTVGAPRSPKETELAT